MQKFILVETVIMSAFQQHRKVTQKSEEKVKERAVIRQEHKAEIDGRILKIGRK